jgi:hypothetical protein
LSRHQAAVPGGVALYFLDLSVYFPKVGQQFCHLLVSAVRAKNLALLVA